MKRFALLLGFVIVGCANTEEASSNSSSAIIGGTEPATSYVEAALIDLDVNETTGAPRTTCSGAVIAPRIVLTAGHCTRGGTSWTVTTPYAGHQKVKSTKKWTEYVSPIGPFVNPQSIDVGLIILPEPIHLPSYPKVSASQLPDGTLARNVGRVKDGSISYSDLFFGREVALGPGAAINYPLAYAADEIIQPGDSGGPTYIETPEGRMIVAVNSGTGVGDQILARVDLVRSKIQAVIDANPE